MKKLLNLVLVALIIVGFTQASNAANTKFVAISDVQLDTRQTPQGYEYSESIKTLDKTIKMINESQADFTVFLGNNISSHKKENLVIFAKMIKRLKKPAYVILGNTDVAQVMKLDKKEYYRLLNKFSHNQIRKVPCVKRMASDTVFIYLDGVNQFIPGNRGNFKDQELIWLEKQLDKYKKDNIVILQHFAAAPSQEERNRDFYNSAQYDKVIAAHKNVIAIITGPNAKQDSTEQDGIQYISIEGLKKDMKFQEIEINTKTKNKHVIKTKTHEVE